MSRVKLTDAQQRAAETVEGPLLIAAGAGSGKTRVLTERLVNATSGLTGRAPVELGEMLAITFTEKAAGELAERVRAGLRVSGQAEKARRVDGAWISTIHSMCARLLRAEALAIGIDPSFQVLGAVDGTRLRNAAFEQAAVDALEVDPAARALFAEYAFAQIAECVYALGTECRARGIAPESIQLEPAEDARALVQRAALELERLGGDFREARCDAGDRHAEACEARLAALRELLDVGVDDAALASLAWRLLVEHKVPGVSKGVTESVGEHRTLKKSLIESCSASITQAMAPALLRLTSSWSRRFLELKRAGGWLDFDDLQVEAARALADPRIRARWQRRFVLTMVDEFQDTDALQLEIVRSLAGDNLCTVGDERQSIYRFRGADVGVFLEHEREMIEAGAERIELRANFRSHAGVLAFVNRLFGSEPLFADSLIELEHGRQEPQPPLIAPDTPRVELLLAEKTGRSSAPERASAAAEIARRVAGLLQAHVGGATAQVKPSDVVVLIPAYRHAQEYAEALRRAGVASIVVGGSRFFECPEIHALRSMCRLVANRGDEEALVQLAASELCGLSDSALLGMRRCVEAGDAHGLWEALLVTELDPDDRAAADLLHEAIEKAGERVPVRPLSDTILNAVEDLDYDLRLVAGGVEGGETYANVLKFARTATAFEEAGGRGLSAFIEYLDAKERFGEHEAPASLGGQAGEAVRVMSIHAAKGLEFPVVVIPEIGEARGGGRGGIARWTLDAKPTISMKLPSSWGELDQTASSAFKRMSEDDKSAENEELKRLFYVGCTRAKEMLILSGASPKEAKSTTMLSLLRDAFGIGEVVGRDIELPGGEVFRVTVVPVGDAESEDAAETVRQQGLAAAEGAAGSDGVTQRGSAHAISPEASVAPAPDRLSYTAISAFEQCPARFHAERVLGMRLPEGVVATPSKQLGLAVHRVLETFGEAQEVDPERKSAIARYYGLDAEAAQRLDQAVGAYRSSSVAETVTAHQTVRREAPFAVGLDSDAGGFVLDGNLDVYAVSDEHALIVDYKTGVEDAQDGELAQRYRLQAGCYALAAMADGRSNVDVVFVRPEAPPRDGDIRKTTFSFEAAEIEAFRSRIIAAHSAMGRNEYSARAAWSEAVCSDCPVPKGECPTRLTQAGSG